MPHTVQVPSPDRLLRVWETGQGAPPDRRAELVLAACYPGVDPTVLAVLPAGEHDRLLIAAHRAMFSPVYDSVADCLHCGTLLEAELPLDEMLGAGSDLDAVLSVGLTCPECGTSSGLVLDPLVFLWADIDDWAWRALAEVHTLASRYGWDEDAILAMSAGRRGAYLTLLAAGRDHREPAGERP